ncbi:zf-CSL-domain-containing protein [Saccharata proteae CBS 121410]|uniref:Diphthamide biosynthesis protein 3 n=1 Tax=Saccharata proteae CBS 121410 TaxID=1314787 RepID=A0A9P4I1V3_9PEZI|nr:zf-CSL-domain-containing protein [Saccharata proteae CBS 121410]
MSESYYDEIEIEDMTYDAALQLYHYPCPCGDRFEISLGDLRDGEDVGVCPSCSLMIKIIFDADDLPKDDGPDNAAPVAVAV